MRGVTLLIAFVVVLLVRNILEPKFIGGQLGLPPIAAMIAMYVGLCVAGVLGMVLFPMGFIMVKHFNDKGYVKLWR
jgi:predicted PurR-regulated permease PerM